MDIYIHTNRYSIKIVDSKKPIETKNIALPLIYKWY